MQNIRGGLGIQDDISYQTFIVRKKSLLDLSENPEIKMVKLNGDFDFKNCINYISLDEESTATLHE